MQSESAGAHAHILVARASISTSMSSNLSLPLPPHAANRMTRSQALRMPDPSAVSVSGTRPDGTSRALPSVRVPAMCIPAVRVPEFEPPSRHVEVDRGEWTRTYRAEISALRPLPLCGEFLWHSPRTGGARPDARVPETFTAERQRPQSRKRFRHPSAWWSWRAWRLTLREHSPTQMAPAYGSCDAPVATTSVRTAARRRRVRGSDRLLRERRL